MSGYRIIRLAWRTLSRNRLRSFFMMLGITVGIAALTAMTSVGETTRRDTVKRFKRMIGTFDVINIQPGAASTRGMPSLASVEPSLKFSDVQAIAAESDLVRRAAGVQFAFDIDIKHRDRSGSAAIFGVSADWMQIRGFNVTQGNVLADEDVRSLARSAIIGTDVRNALFADEDPIGKTIRIAEVPFQVTGILQSRGIGPGGSSMDNLLIIPVTTASKRLFNRNYLTSIAVQLKNPQQADRAMKEIASILREHHGIVPPGKDDFTLSNPRAAMARVSRVDTTLSRLLIGMVAIATLIGGTVIMSLMLIAVSERRQEIGIRRAVGATRRDVMAQFLAEAVLISVIGGLTGILLGTAAAVIAASQQHLAPAVLWSAVSGSVALSIGVGLVFGLQPAWRAERIDPIEALRS